MPSTDQVCETCGKVHDRGCKAHNRAGGPCGRIPKRGMTVCKVHGGASPNARNAAAVREAEERARRALREAWGKGEERPIGDPLSELAQVAAEIIAFKDALRAQVEELNGVLTYWQEKDYLDSDGGIEWTKAAEDMRAVVTAYERALDRSAKVLGNIVKLDLAGRMLAFNTAQAEQITTAVRDGLGTVDLSREIREAALEAIADALDRAAGTTPAPKELTA